jgi:hypothetical protein
MVVPFISTFVTFVTFCGYPSLGSALQIASASAYLDCNWSVSRQMVTGPSLLISTSISA